MSSDVAPRTSIIIAVKSDNPNLRECLEACGRLTDQDFEILVLPDEPCSLPFPKTRVLPTGPAGPSSKRDRGCHEARGSLLAILDDDAYPAPDWLSAAVAVLQPAGVAAVGGPAVTPPGDSPAQQASGLVYASRMVGGPYVYRYLPRPARDVDDYPTCNLIIKKEAYQKIGGFDTCYWPGEDTVVCLKLTRDLKQRIVYDPRVLVYHHRRPLFRGHLRQVASYALHRGYFVKKFPQTSLRASYFLPTLLVAGLGLGWAPALVWPRWVWPWALAAAAYFLWALGSGLAARPARLIAWKTAGIIATHAVYGVCFLKGLLVRRLHEEGRDDKNQR
jgi:cellulose synthase/poly-beta-1,6-N-acetylglucosamine synthase-like glycosyltransferase